MEIIIILFLTLLNGFFALSEIALVSVNRSKIEQLAENGNTKAHIILELIDNPQNFLSSVQVGITLIGIIAGAYGGVTLTGKLSIHLHYFTFLGEYTETVAFILVIGSITYFNIVIGELVPKSIAMNNANRIALFCSPIIKYFTIAVYPFVKLLSLSTELIIKLLGIKVEDKDHLSEDELKYLLLKASKQGVLESEEGKIHQNLFYFTDQTAKSLMTPLKEVEWINKNESTNEIYTWITNSIHSKFLVCDNEITSIVGILTAKDFLENYKKENFLLTKIIERPVFIKDNTPAFKILNLFKIRKQYIAAVTNTDNKLVGIITLQDLIVAIIGRLPEENEDELIHIIPREDGSYLVNGNTPVFELNQYFQRTVIKDDIPFYTTVEGFILKTLIKTPHTGNSFTSGQYYFEILDMDNQKIDKVLLKRIRKIQKQKL